MNEKMLINMNTNTKHKIYKGLSSIDAVADCRKSADQYRKMAKNSNNDSDKKSYEQRAELCDRNAKLIYSHMTPSEAAVYFERESQKDKIRAMVEKNEEIRKLYINSAKKKKSEAETIRKLWCHTYEIATMKSIYG